MTQESRFTGKYVWLVGASHGIGRALAIRLAQEGAYLALSGRDEKALNLLAIELSEHQSHDRHIVLPLDVRNVKQVGLAWHKLLQTWKQLDCFIYNAGIYEPMSAKELNLISAEMMVDVNFTAAFRFLHSVIPYFLTEKQGHIVLVASVAGYRGLPKAIGYGASKAGLLHLAENLKVDLADTNIKVQVVNPGFVKTRLTEKNQFKMPALVSPEFAANAILYGMKSRTFDIHFPLRFTLLLKLLRLLPYPLYFWLVNKLL